MMRKSCALSIVVILGLGATAPAVGAQRTFVGATATDNPSCSLPAPCRTFSAAIAATSPGGEVIVLDSAGYGAVTITKSVSIIAPSGIYAGISVLSGDGVTINAPGATVVLRGLTINGQGGGNGIRSLAADRVRIESCVVSKMGAVGIYHQASNGEMIVLDTIVRDNQDGIGLVAADATITLDHVRSEHNNAAGFYIAPTSGSSYARAHIVDGLFSENNGNGLWADSVNGATTVIRVVRSVVSGNKLAGFYATSGNASSVIDATLTQNSFQGTNLPVPGVHLYAPSGSLTALAFDNTIATTSSLTSLRVEGPGAWLWASGNKGNSLYCAGANVQSWGNNHFVSGVTYDSCTHGTPYPQ